MPAQQLAAVVCKPETPIRQRCINTILRPPKEMDVWQVVGPTKFTKIDVFHDFKVQFCIKMVKSTDISQVRTVIWSINLRDCTHTDSNFHIGFKQTWGDQGPMQN